MAKLPWLLIAISIEIFYAIRGQPTSEDSHRIDADLQNIILDELKSIQNQLRCDKLACSRGLELSERCEKQVESLKNELTQIISQPHDSPFRGLSENITTENIVGRLNNLEDTLATHHQYMRTSMTYFTQNTTHDTRELSTRLNRLEELLNRQDIYLKKLDQQQMSVMEALNQSLYRGFEQYLEFSQEQLKSHLATINQSLQISSGALKQNFTMQFQDLSIQLEGQGENISILNRNIQQHYDNSRNQGELTNKLVQDVYTNVVAPRDCDEIRATGQRSSGVYTVYPGNVAKRTELSVYCDLTSSDEGWLVFQRRSDGSENFERTWVEYASGFGNLSGEFWLGNDALHILTSNRRYKLRVELEDFDMERRYAEYTNFSIGSSSEKYILKLSGFFGNAGDSLSPHNGFYFSTKDVDNDVYSGSCAEIYKGAWWYSICHSSNLNGLYLRGNHSSYADGIEWDTFRGQYYSLKTTEMKMTPLK